MSKTNVTPNIVTFEHRNPLADSELDAVTGGAVDCNDATEIGGRSCHDALTLPMLRSPVRNVAFRPQRQTLRQPQGAPIVRWHLRAVVDAVIVCSGRLSPPTRQLQLIDVSSRSPLQPGHRQNFRTMEGSVRFSATAADKRRLPRRAVFPKCVSRDQAAAFEAKPIDESTTPSRKSTNSVVPRAVASGGEAPGAAGNRKRPDRTLPHAGMRDFDTAGGD